MGNEAITCCAERGDSSPQINEFIKNHKAASAHEITEKDNKAYESSKPELVLPAPKRHRGTDLIRKDKLLKPISTKISDK